MNISRAFEPPGQIRAHEDALGRGGRWSFHEKDRQLRRAHPGAGYFESDDFEELKNDTV